MSNSGNRFLAVVVVAAAVSAWEAAAVAAALVGFSGVAAVSLSGLGVRLKTVLNIYIVH